MPAFIKPTPAAITDFTVRLSVTEATPTPTVAIAFSANVADAGGNQLHKERNSFRSIGGDLTLAELRNAFDRAFGAGAGQRIRVSCPRVNGVRTFTEVTVGLEGDISATPDVLVRVHSATAANTFTGPTDITHGEPRVFPIADPQYRANSSSSFKSDARAKSEVGLRRQTLMRFRSAIKTRMASLGVEL